MQARTLTTLAVTVMISGSVSGCSGEQGGGETRPQPTPSESVPESDPAGVGGTSNQ